MEENQCYKAIQQSDENAFTQLFHRYYERLCNFSLHYSIPEEIAEEIVSDVFVTLWKRRKTTQIRNLRLFLYTSTKNASINWLRSKTNQLESKSNEVYSNTMGEADQEKKMILKEELSSVQKVIDKMPEQRQIIFKLNRIDGLKYKEIAEVLSISPHTVQNQMVQAVRFLYEHYPNKQVSK